ncbi:cation diffusion facilitator family transporter [Xinfangfangia sp. D13-10-4-6]|uniref:cation diffusion facilitator family transporter n=1 Tax=Pseudogemmobacter hezensis TaxID=2737662 RepID=UPI0015567D90|nr:cation diffusion facilitator family transporter [Pseudogemmobacter hezensis]NPD16427.1 cation diffusion facilitator family transporter [Pseudogemmobacter hezensis]
MSLDRPQTSPDRPQPDPQPHKWLSLSAGIASVLVASTLVGLKLWAVLATGALSVAASLADSAVDLVMSLAAATAILYAARPADDDHAFGHSSAEDLTALAQALLILGSGAYIGWSALQRMISGDSGPIGSEAGGTLVMVASILLTLGLVWWQGRVARLTGSRVVAADRLHYLGDLVPAVGAIIALQASQHLGVRGLDSWVALLAAAIMVMGAARIGKAAWDALMDRRADPALIAAIADLTRSWPGVLGFHDLKTRTSGSRVFVNLHIELDGEQSLRDAHAIGAALRREILARWPQTDVIIHKDVAAKDGQPGT